MENKQKIGYIYLITNKIDDKKYVGFTCVSVKKRWKAHLFYAKSGYRNWKRSNSYLYNAISIHGEENFDVQEICCGQDAKIIKNIWEPYFIRFYNTHYSSDYGYNLTYGGEGTLGYKRTKEQRLAMRERNLGRKDTKEQIERKKLLFAGSGNPMYGKHHSEETKRKISEILKGKPGRKYTEEQKKEISKRMTGKKVSEEARKNMSLAQKGHKGHPHTEEHKQYMREKMKGRVIKPESIEKIRNCWNNKYKSGYIHPSLGTHLTEEHKEKIRIKNYKPILQYNLNMEFIKEWKSTKEIYNELHITPAAISMCCGGRSKTSGGFIWRHKNCGRVLISPDLVMPRKKVQETSLIGPPAAQLTWDEIQKEGT